MTDAEIYTELTGIFRRELGNDSITLSSDTTADDVEGWDSMNHIFILVAIEKRFGVKFQAAEMEELKNVGELVGILRTKLTANA